MHTCFTTTIAGFDITLGLQLNGKFLVIYGQQQTDCDTYEQTAKELGLCMMHAIACAGMMDNGE